MLMTYRMLAELIGRMSEEQKDSTVLICDESEEFFAAQLEVAIDLCELDDNQPYLRQASIDNNDTVDEISLKLQLPGK